MSTSEVKRFGADLGICLLGFFLKLFRELVRHLKNLTSDSEPAPELLSISPRAREESSYGESMYKGLPVGLCLCGSAPQ